MSQKIRIGNDIDIRWSLFDNDEQPYNLDGRNVSIELNVGTKKVRIKEVETEGNTVHFIFYGKDQKYTGAYILKFIENDKDIEMVTFDIKDAFTLVEHSWQAIDEGETPETVQLEFVTITSALLEKVGPKGDKGDTGDPAGFGEVTVDVDDGTGTPSAEATATGPDTAKNLHFSFHNLVPDVSQFVTRTVDDLANYYLKSETYTKAEVQALIADIPLFHWEVVAVLPETGASNVIYLLGPMGEGSDMYEEYIWDGEWVKIGDTSLDLSDYLKKTAQTRSSTIPTKF